MTVGRPSEEILRVAKEKDIDFIVIGARGKTGIEKIMVGTTTEKVVRNAPCSVFVVREQK